MASDDDIIIKGGSVEIEFDENTFTGNGGKHGNQNKKLVSVEVVDDDTGQRQNLSLPASGKCTIRITTK